MLYWENDEDKGKERCTKCNAFGYKTYENNSYIGYVIDSQKKNKPKPNKNIEVFPT